MKHFNFFLITLAAFVITGCKSYHQNQGSVFGTYYNIQYQSFGDKQDKIEECLKAFDASLSVYNDTSIISLINQNKENIVTDAYFEHMFEIAQRVSDNSDGAFDITVAPLVNAWGFGFQHEANVDETMIDSLLEFVNFKSVSLVDHHVIKQDPRTMLDASALAKGYACDIVADMLAKEGCKNYLVEIGGEVVVRGKNNHGDPWTIGITKPVDDPSGNSQELQEAVATSNVCMATSGNYRNYYIKDGVRRSHTIDPKTGYPVQHKLLSATIIAPSCIEADAMATACMVLGEYKAAVMVSMIRNTAYYFILTDDEGNLITKTSNNWSMLLNNGAQ